MKLSCRLQTCALAALVSCGGNETPKPEMAASRAPAPGQAAQVKPVTAAIAHEPAPVLALRVVRTPAGVGLRVINAGNEAVSLAAHVLLEELGAPSPRAMAEPSLLLQQNCKSTGCVTLAAGAEIDAPSWLERTTGQRCGALLVPRASGVYRLGVQTCSGAQVTHVEFTWPVQ